ncbi:MAG TPA: alpha/beta hydrolase [Acidimicrobiales bacterium]|jgi:pimeloyl-ACP methyl ester carboxylesterase|nr:alpha/beta fold hydrolase [Actinomycetes bacterium]MDP6177133.1 alpha/beta hydrolase [Acidimicrobiales bacterium]MDP7124896.1 alpha/beta hydrolase [Acidimicrobiales bacterium]MDP7352403.1 alpha/beta hydrolase [Acidimicrobiales bacterium]HJL76779.1 alpha/beta hydrolase [Acidimicrobiales bacterium]|tara:strand:- start:808 stop:1635 length:828 start_codon:yes stop_codon:yes gene_type:complete
MGNGTPVELYVEAFGPVDGEPVLLLSGADAQCTRWTPALVDPLVDAGHRVVRFDTRDCGLSSKLSSDDGYTLDDLATDACRVLDGEGIEAAHLVGRSMGGMVAQVVALEHPERARSLTLLCSTPGLGDERLPPPDDRLVDQMTERLFAPPPVDHVEKVAWLVELDRLFVGTRYPFDETAATLVADADVTRCWFPETGHGPAVNSSPSRLDRLGDIGVRTLVVHGTVDPVFPVEHGIALAEGIPGADLWLVEGLGHEVPDACLAELLPKVLAHLAG